MSNLSLTRLAAWATLCLASLCPTVQAQSQDLELFDQPRFGGTRLRLPGDVADVAAYGLGNHIASVIVVRGQWEFCTRPNFGGACITIGPGRYGELPVALRGALASVRRADIVAAMPPPPPPPPQMPPQPPVYQQPAPPQMPPRPLATPIYHGQNQSRDAIVLYEHSNFDGRALALSGPMARLGDHGFNDTASSVLIQRGRWQLCEHADFGGECMVLNPGRHTLSGRYNDFVSSVRPVFGQDNRPMQRHGAVVLFDNIDFTGRQILLHDAVVDLRAMNMNDSTSAVEVWGGQWELCTRADFTGHCILLTPGRYQLDGSMNDRISSLRPR